MQEKKNKRINILFIVLNILITISLVLALVLKNNFSYSLYWFIIPLLMVVSLLTINKWSVVGTSLDIDKGIQRSFDDSTVIITVFYGLIYLITEFIDILKEDVRHNPYFIIGFFIITIVYEFFIYLSIYNARKDTAKKLEEKYNKK